MSKDRKPCVGAFQAYPDGDLEISLMRFENGTRYVAKPVRLEWKSIEEGESFQPTLKISGRWASDFRYAIIDALSQITAWHAKKKDEPSERAK